MMEAAQSDKRRSSALGGLSVSLHEPFTSHNRSTIGEILPMTSPNNNFQTSDTDARITTACPRMTCRPPIRQKKNNNSSSKLTREHHLRKRSDPPPHAIALASPRNEDDGDSNDGRNLNNSATALAVSACQTRRRPQPLFWGPQNIVSTNRSLPGSVDSDQSYYTEQTYYSDTQLHSTHNRSDCNFSIDAEEGNDSDGSSCSSNNFHQRNNASFQTLDSVFSLNDLGSIGTLSSVTIDEVGCNNCEWNEQKHEEEDKQNILITFSPSLSRNPQQRQPRRFVPSSSRKTRRQNRSLKRSSHSRNSEDFGEFTEEEKGDEELEQEELSAADREDLADLAGMEQLTINDSTLAVPILPEKVTDDRNSIRNDCAGSELDEMQQIGEEELTVVEIETETVSEVLEDEEEYIEEVVENDTDDYNTSVTISSLQDDEYEIVVEEESFVEENLVEDDEVTIGNDEIQ